MTLLFLQKRSLCERPKLPLERSTNLAHPSLVRIATNVIGQAGITTLADTNAPGCGPFFYRVGVDE